MRIYELPSGKEKKALPTKYSLNFTRASFVGDGKKLVFVHDDFLLEERDIETNFTKRVYYSDKYSRIGFLRQFPNKRAIGNYLVFSGNRAIVLTDNKFDQTDVLQISDGLTISASTYLSKFYGGFDLSEMSLLELPLFVNNRLHDLLAEQLVKRLRYFGGYGKNNVSSIEIEAAWARIALRSATRKAESNREMTEEDAEDWSLAIKKLEQDVERLEAEVEAMRKYQNNPVVSMIATFGRFLLGINLYFIIGAISWVAGNVVAFVFLWPTVRILNRYLDAQLKNAAYGNDVFGETVHRVRADRFGEDVGWKALPEQLSDAIVAYTEQFALSALKKLRNILGIISDNKTKSDFYRMMESQLTWKELVHTAYFDVDDFIKLVVVALSNSGFVKPSGKLLNDPDYETVGLWYREMRPVQSVAE